MKLLVVVEHYYPYIGGAETLFKTLCEELTQQGFNVRVLTTRFRPDLAPQEEIGGVAVHRIDCGNRFLFSALALPAVIRHGRWADVIHTTTYNAALPAWLGAKLCRVPVVVTFHEVWGKLWLRLPFLSRVAANAYYAFEQLLLRLPFDRYVAVSKFTALALAESGVDKSKVEHIYNGLDYSSLQPDHRPPARFTYTYFGRLGVSKGLDLIIPAAALFQQRHPGSRLRLIIPKRPAALYNTILALLDHHHLRNHVELLHELPEANLREAIATSSCVLITSYSEGFCYVAAETAAIGVPIVSSGQGALIETVSGPHVIMAAMTVPATLEALEQAHRGDYRYTPTRRFHLKDSIARYVNFYHELRNKGLTRH